MVQVRVLGVALDSSMQHIVLLKPMCGPVGGAADVAADAGADDGRVLPIWVGAQEANSIAIAIEGGQAPRPLTHDLMKMVLDTVGAVVERVEVTRIDDGTFYAEITLRTRTGIIVLDARPSDSVALAVRVGSPIWVADDVLEEAGIPAGMVELGEESAGGSSAESAPDAPAPADSTKLDERELDEFMKFLEDVDPEDFQG